MSAELTDTTQSHNIVPTHSRDNHLINRNLLSIIVVALIALLLGVAGAAAQSQAPRSPNAAQAAIGTAFTYQGRLTHGGHPANGLYDFQFALYDAPAAGDQIGGIVSREDISVTNGVFTVDLDFGNAFNDDERYLEIGVRPGDSTGAYTTLTPRRKLNPVPLTIYAFSAGTATTATFAAQADLLDGQHASAFAAASHAHAGEDITTGTVADARIAAAIARDSEIVPTVIGAGFITKTLADITYAPASHTHPGSDITSAVPTATLALWAAQASWFGLTDVPAGFADGIDNDTTYAAGYGLALNGAQFGVVTSTIQQRLASGCPDGEAIRIVNQDGTVACQAMSGTGGGDITSVYAGTGLTGGGESGAVTLTVAFAGPGAANTVARSDHTHSGADITTGVVADAYLASTIARDSEIIPTVTAAGFITRTLADITYAPTAHAHSGDDITTGTVADARIDAAIARDSEITPTVWANDGAASGLDADLLDGQHASAFASSSHAHSGDDITTGTVADARIAAAIARDNEITPTVAAAGFITKTLADITYAPTAHLHLGSDITSAVPTATLALNVVTSTVQARVSGTCTVGSSIRAINADGTVVCDKPATFYSPLYRPMSLDLATVDAGLKGFTGGFTDGRYGYFVPHRTSVTVPFGKVARVDLQNFVTSTVTVLDLTTVDTALKGFRGGFTDGRYGYFVPQDNMAPQSFGKIARVDLQNFVTSTVTVLDLTTVDSSLKGFMGGFAEGRYGYLVPFNNDAYFGKVVRVDLQNFVTSTVTVLDLSTVDTDLRGFWGGFSDGRYGYFVPHMANGTTYSGKAARVDLQNFSTSGVTVLDLSAVDTDLVGFMGGFTDGRYGYFVPSNASAVGKVARVDLQNFVTSTVTVLNLSAVDADLKGFDGGFTDGRYGYFVPFNNGTSSGKMARVDLQNFTTSGVTMLDLAATDSALKGFSGGFTDGRYGYFVPSESSTVARIQLFFGGGAP